MPSSFAHHATASRFHDGFLRAVGALENSGDASFVHHGNAVAVSENLLHVAADHQNGDAGRGKPPHQLIDLGFRTDIDTSRRFVKQDHSRLQRQPLRENDLLLVSSAQACGLRLNGGRLDLQFLTRCLRSGELLPPADPAAGQKTGKDPAA